VFLRFTFRFLFGCSGSGRVSHAAPGLGGGGEEGGGGGRGEEGRRISLPAKFRRACSRKRIFFFLHPVFCVL
jgi:hypothetical protein